jgi:uncharacterized lipoprotein YmbA
MTLLCFKTLTACLLALGLTACAVVPQETFYTLQPLPQPHRWAIPDIPTVVVGPVTLPPLVDRPQWVVRQNDSEVRILEQQRWASPLDEEIAQAIATHVTALTFTLAYAQTSSSVPTFPVKPKLRIQINVLRFTSILSPTPRIDDELQWAVSCTASSALPENTPPRTGRYAFAPSVLIPTIDAVNLYANMALLHADTVGGASQHMAEAVKDMLTKCPSP